MLLNKMLIGTIFWIVHPKMHRLSPALMWLPSNIRRLMEGVRMADDSIKGRIFLIVGGKKLGGVIDA